MPGKTYQLLLTGIEGKTTFICVDKASVLSPADMHQAWKELTGSQGTNDDHLKSTIPNGTSLGALNGTGLGVNPLIQGSLLGLNGVTPDTYSLGAMIGQPASVKTEEGFSPLYRHGVCKWPGCDTECCDMASFTKDASSVLVPQRGRTGYTQTSTIGELRKKVIEVTRIKNEDLRVLYCGKELTAKDEYGKVQTLEDYNIGDRANLFVVLRLGGGSNETEVQPKMYDSEVQLTDKPDMFTLDDEEGGQRAEMPCGHAIGPESLTAYCRSLLSAGKYEFRCPYKASTIAPFCDKLWEFFTVKRLAVLTNEELKEFETKVTENYLRKSVGIQECPKCESYCERKSKKDQRVVCPICTRKKGKLYEFCWFCLKSWLTHETEYCGNFGCTGKDPRLRIIENCPKKTVVKVPNCPAVRACPTCGLLIEHKERCKQMVCPCGQKFCFICLTKANSGGQYQCGTWNFKCTVAPVQTAIPGN